MKYLATSLIALMVAGVGCGGEHHHAEHGEGEHHKHEMKGPVGDLHGVLAPIWHDKGADRLAKACDQQKVMAEKVTAVEAAKAPEGSNAEAYTTATKALTATSTDLGAACAVDGRPDVEAKFSAFHDAFHKVMEASEQGHHDHH